MQIRQLVVDIGNNGAVAEFSGGKLTVTGIEPGQLFAALGEIEKIIAPKKEEPKCVGLEAAVQSLECARNALDQKIVVGVDVASRPDETFTIPREAEQPDVELVLDGYGAPVFLKKEAAKVQPVVAEPPRREAKPEPTVCSAQQAADATRARKAKYANMTPGQIAEDLSANPLPRATVERDRDSAPVIPAKPIPAEAKPVEPAVIPVKEHLRAAPEPAFVKPTTGERPAAEPAKTASDAWVDEHVVVGVVRDQPADDSDENEPEKEETKEELDAKLAASAQRDAEYNARIAAKKAEQAQAHVRAAVKAEDPGALVKALRDAPRPTPPAPKSEPRAIEPAPAQEEAPAEPADDAEPEFKIGTDEREYNSLGPVVRAVMSTHKGTLLGEDADKLAELCFPFCRKWVKPIREAAGTDDAVKKDYTRRFKQLFAISG